ncbi:MAG: sensor histidine kinase [Kaiparowitsia implicata GSE-PSE-MK54-09C]|nr:sensor histidine kinase [Kaiparowitsia implicata GSE-PSE-MK54-09C]
MTDPRRFTSLRNHPFPILLYLEWVLVGAALLFELLPLPFPRMRSTVSVIRLLSIMGFGLMGLRLPLPTQRRRSAVLYTMLEFALVLLATPAGNRRVLMFPFLYVVLVVRSCLIFRMSGRLVVTVASFFTFLGLVNVRLIQIELQMPEGVGDRFKSLLFGLAFNSTLLFGLALLFVLLLVNALMSERESREKLAAANEQLRDYALRVETLAMEQERSRIARDIHDSLGHALTALNLQLEGALRLWQTNTSQALEFLKQAKRLGSMALQEVRESVSAMRTDPWQGRMLDEAIALLLSDFQQLTHIHPTCDIQLHQTLSSDVNTSLYRIVQEALTNIAKHANATQVTVGLHATETTLYLTIQDNGSGFEVTQNQSGFGLQSMRERTLALGGRFDILSRSGEGCRLSITLPVSPLEPS